MGQTLLFSDPQPLVERLGRDFFRQLTERPGVYLMRDAQEQVLYVGKAKNLKRRLHSYRVANPDRLPRRHLRLLRAVARIELQECADENSALAREADLLLALRPKFNRAGVWPATSHFLVWHCADHTLALTVTESPETGGQVFGPFGRSVIYFRAALVRLLWFALHPEAGSAAMPAGWTHGRLGKTAALGPIPDEVETILARFFAGDVAVFLAWINERTGARIRSFDLAMRDADLETVTSFMAAKARRAPRFIKVDRQPDTQRLNLNARLPFADASWKQA